MTSTIRVRRKPWDTSKAFEKPEHVLSDTSFWSHSVISPLRYPGAKRQLVPLIEELIRANALAPPRLLVEPFCGGATASLRAVGRGAVEHIVLADANDLVAAFWYTAAFDTTWLVNAMWEESATVDRWDWFRLSDPTGRRLKALKCLFLNRTSFSGIFDAHAGPIGGRTQDSKYKIDCRFGKEGLERRIRAVGELANTGRLLDVWNCDWRESIARTQWHFGELGTERILMYMDPPYVEKAERLYGLSFEEGEHRALARALSRASGFNWILSYDDHQVIRDLYANASKANSEATTVESPDQPPGEVYSPLAQSLLVPHTYTARAGSRVTKCELLFTSYSDLPDSDRFTRFVPN